MNKIVGVFYGEGTLRFKNDEVCRINFKIPLRRACLDYEIENFCIPFEMTDEYWNYLMCLAEEEQRSNKQ